MSPPVRPAATVTSLFVHPVKSCGAVEQAELEVAARGPARDREWLVVDAEGVFLTQRQVPRLALVRPAFEKDCLVLQAPGTRPLALPLRPTGAARTVSCWGVACEAVDAGEEAASWWSEWLERPARLVHLADGFERVVNPRRSPQRVLTTFTDGYPFLVIGRESLADLNRRLEEPLPMDRFRPNLVVEGAGAYAEDRWRRIRVGELELELVKPCERCQVTTTDQQTAERGREPLATLARYRRSGRHVLFGQNGVHRGTGWLRVGDPVEVLQEQEAPRFEARAQSSR